MLVLLKKNTSEFNSICPTSLVGNFGNMSYNTQQSGPHLAHNLNLPPNNLLGPGWGNGHNGGIVRGNAFRGNDWCKWSKNNLYHTFQVCGSIGYVAIVYYFYYE